MTEAKLPQQHDELIARGYTEEQIETAVRERPDGATHLMLEAPHRENVEPAYTESLRVFDFLDDVERDAILEEAIHGVQNPTDSQKWSPNYTNGWAHGAPSGVTIHTMEGYFDPSVSWLCNRQSWASAHFCIRKDGHITQLVHQNDRAWHARDSGMYYFGIEHEGGSGVGALDPFWTTSRDADHLRDDDHLLNASARLTAFLCLKWNIRIQHDFGPVRRDTTSHIAGHNQMAGNDHVDPGTAFPWRAYMRAVHSIAGR